MSTSSRNKISIADHPATAHILVIDDELRMRESVKALLSAHGLNVFVAESGAEGLKILSEYDIDIVLLDLMMPEMTGHEVMERINESEIDVEVIVTSGDATFDNATAMIRTGAVDFISKPYEPEVLVHTIDKIVHQQMLNQQMEDMHSRLEASEERYHFIVNNSPDIIYMLDHRGHFTFVNRRITDLLGYDYDDVIGHHISELIHYDDQLKSNYVFDLEQRIENRSRTIELRLNYRDNAETPRYFENRSVTIDLNRMGVDGPQTDLNSAIYLGTYGIARDISDQKRAEAVIDYHLNHDFLTGLPNRMLLCDRLHQAMASARRNQRMLALLYLDLDGFKYINDTLGHLHGDQLLQQAAHRLRSALRESDTLARVGGDEFILLLPEVTSLDELEKVAEKIQQQMTKPIEINKHNLNISFSTGIAIFPQDGESADTLIKNADIAMFHSKSRGKNNFEYFAGSMTQIYSQRLTLEQGLRQAMSKKQLILYYQPQFDLFTQKITGVEALIRWNHPENGLIMPGDFIPHAEETGQIVDIGTWTINQACKQLRKWLDDGIAPIKMAVNISAQQLQRTDFEQIVLKNIERYKIPSGLLELEITEGVLLQDIDTVILKLKILSLSGITFAIDDFGIGYSSLSYLQKLPIDTLKIDRSFLETIIDETSRSPIITAVVAMAKELEMNVLVEGVETLLQCNYLKSMNCRDIQGFLIARPAPPDEVVTLLCGVD